MLRLAVQFLLVSAFLVSDVSAVKGLRTQRIEEDDHHHPDISGACGAMEKAIKCKGGFKGGKSGKMCEGYMKMGVVANLTDDSVVSSVTEGLELHLADYMPKIEFDAETMEALQALDNEELQEGFEKSIVVGGTMGVKFGCKMKFFKKKGKIGKMVECGAKGGGKMGIIPKGTDSFFEEQEEE